MPDELAIWHQTCSQGKIHQSATFTSFGQFSGFDSFKFCEKGVSSVNDP